MPRLTGNRCQCPTCGEYFNGVQPFDKHRAGKYAKPGQQSTRRCLSVAEMTARGWMRNPAGFWCERADPRARPRAPVSPARRAPSARVSPYPLRKTPVAAERAQEHRLRKAGAP